MAGTQELLARLERRFGRLCFFCETAQATTIDHFFPRSLGGGEFMLNLVPACESCNWGKSDRLPTQAELLKHARLWGREEPMTFTPDPWVIEQCQKERDERIALNERKMQQLSAEARQKRLDEWRKKHPLPIKQGTSRAVTPKQVLTQKVRSRGKPKKKKPKPPQDSHPLMSRDSVVYVPQEGGGMKRISSEEATR